MSKPKKYTSLDELAEDFPLQRVWYRVIGSLPTSETQQGAILGYVFTLPRSPGKGKEPALVISTKAGTGHLYPDEVTRKEFDKRPSKD